MSFSSNTNVLLASGAAIPISQPVAAVLVHHDTDLYDLTVRTAHGTSVIDTTSSHLFWDPAWRRWVKAASLGVGEPLMTPGGSTAYADGGSIPASQDGWMWDLTIPGGHDFYIQAAMSAVLVHNCPSGPDGGMIAARSVRFTQDSIGANFKNGGSVMQLGEDLANGAVSPADLPEIRVFEQDGDLYSLDNRRLFAGQMADVDLQYRMATQQEMDAELPWKFTTTNQGTGIEVRGVGEFSWLQQ
jgi:hypothetical protein